MQFEFWMKEITGTTLISTSTLQTLISPCHKYWMHDLEKTRNINIPTKILLHRPQNLQNLSISSKHQTWQK